MKRTILVAALATAVLSTPFAVAAESQPAAGARPEVWAVSDPATLMLASSGGAVNVFETESPRLDSQLPAGSYRVNGTVELRRASGASGSISASARCRLVQGPSEQTIGTPDSFDFENHWYDDANKVLRVEALVTNQASQAAVAGTRQAWGLKVKCRFVDYNGQLRQQLRVRFASLTAERIDLHQVPLGGASQY